MELLEFFDHLVPADFMPHGYCYLWDPWLVWLNVASDGLITLSYYGIPVVLIYFIHKRRDLPFNWIFWMFGGFILACGTTHLMEIWNVWHASYLLAGVIKAVTAAISVITLILLIPLLPQAIGIHDLMGLQERNRSLEAQIAARKRLEDAQLDAPFRHRMMAGAALAVFFVGFMGFLSWRSGRLAATESDRVTQTHAVMQALQSTLGNIVETENSSRAFALSGNPVLLAHYRATRKAATQGVDSLRQLTADNAGQQQRIDLLEPRISAAIALADGMVARRLQTQTILEDSAVLQSERLMDAMQSTARTIQTEQTTLLRQRTQKTDAARRLNGLITISGTLAGMIFMAWSGFAIQGEMDAKAGVRAQLNLLNAELEQRVDQRTAALQETQDRLSGILGSAMDAIITVDSDRHILLFNSAAEQLFGCPAAEALGQPIARFIPQRFQAAHGEHVSNLGEGGGTNRAMGAMNPLWAVRASGKEFQIEASISQIVTGRKKLFTIILRDITERVQTQAALRANEEMQRMLLDGVTDYAVYMVDPEGKVASWNVGAARIEGYSRDEILGKPISVFYPPEQRAGGTPDQALQEALSKGRFEGQGVRLRKDGSTFWAQVVILPIYDQSGTLRGFSKVLHDITKHKQAEEKLAVQARDLARQSGELMVSQQALEAQSLMLQSVLDSMAEGLVAVDGQGKFIIWNPAAQKIVGLGAANLESQQWSEHYGLFQDDMVTPFPSDQNPLARAIRGETSSAQMFVRNPEMAEGIWIEANAGPLKDKHGTVHGGVVAFRDITQKRNSEREINQLNSALESRVAERTAQLKEANLELESFTYSVAHDLRAPLRHIAGFSGILMEECHPLLNAEAQRYLYRIQEGTRKMGQLVDELLTLARVGRQALSLRVAGLNSIVTEVIGMLQPEIEGRQVEWKIGDLPFIECDPTLLKQVFQNLISNALKYSRPRSPAVIEIGRMQIDGESVVFVRDNGVGFSMKYADKLFGVFQRLHRSEDFEGTGVGLATAQRIIKKHQGKIWAEAELDKGATFYFTLGDLQRPAPATESMGTGA